MKLSISSILSISICYFIFSKLTDIHNDIDSFSSISLSNIYHYFVIIVSTTHNPLPVSDHTEWWLGSSGFRIPFESTTPLLIFGGKGLDG